MAKPILSTFNVQDSIDFYVNALGYSLNWKMDGDDGNPNFASVSLGSSEIMLGTIDFVKEEDRKRMGAGIQLYVELPKELKIHDVYEQLIGQNADITKKLEKREWGEWAFVLNDPNGYNLMIAQTEDSKS